MFKVTSGKQKTQDSNGSDISVIEENSTKPTS